MLSTAPNSRASSKPLKCKLSQAPKLQVDASKSAHDGVPTAYCRHPPLRLERSEPGHPDLQSLRCSYHRVLGPNYQTFEIHAGSFQRRQRSGTTFSRRDLRQSRLRFQQRRHHRLCLRQLLPPPACLRRYRRGPHLP